MTAITTIRTTCSICLLSLDIPSTSVVLVLPVPTADPGPEPGLVHLCPGCRAGQTRFVSWRTATYLLDAGATVLTDPDTDRLRPRHPEQRPTTESPMTLDDLIDLLVALDSDAALHRTGRLRPGTSGRDEAVSPSPDQPCGAA
jgi:hypothetical protein